MLRVALPKSSADRQSRTFPDAVYLLHLPKDGKHGIFKTNEGVHGLVCFSNESGVHDYARSLEISAKDYKPEYASIEVAEAISQKKPAPINSIILLDDEADPLVREVLKKK